MYRETVSPTAFHLTLCYQTAYNVILGLIINNIFGKQRLLFVALFLLAMQICLIKSFYEIESLDDFLHFKQENGIEETLNLVFSFFWFFFTIFTIYY